MLHTLRNHTISVVQVTVPAIVSVVQVTVPATVKRGITNKTRRQSDRGVMWYSSLRRRLDEDR